MSSEMNPKSFGTFEKRAPGDSCDDMTTASTFSSVNAWDFSSSNFVVTVLDVHVIVVCAATYWM